MLPIQPIKPQALHAIKRAGKTSGAAGFVVEHADQPPQAVAMSSASSLSSTSAMNALLFQEVEDALERKKRHAKRGQDVLGTLDVLKAEVLNGQINEASLIDLKNQLANMKSEAVEGDAYLSGLLEQIEIRAAVELAKRGMM